MTPEQRADLQNRLDWIDGLHRKQAETIEQLTAERDSLKGLLSGSQTELRDAVAAWGKAERERDEALAIIDVRDHEYEQLETRYRAFLGAGARLEAQLREARAAIDRVRALHKPVKSPANTGGITYCLDCSSGSLTGLVEHPCGTIRALDGGGA